MTSSPDPRIIPRPSRLIPLEITQFLLGESRTICPMLIENGGRSLLVDAGYPGQAPVLLAAIREAGLPEASLSAVFLTHHDIDHIGGLPGLIASAPNKLTVLTGSEEKPYVEGSLPLLKLAAAREQLVRMPEAMGGPLLRLLQQPPKAPVDAIVGDGEPLPLPFASDWIAVATPGHTPGHISLFQPSSRTLIAGDALEVKDGKLAGPDPALCHDAALAYASLRKLAALQPEAIWCYHGGVVRGEEAGPRLAELASRPFPG